jgi:hypothetical protein
MGKNGWLVYTFCCNDLGVTRIVSCGSALGSKLWVVKVRSAISKNYLDKQGPLSSELAENTKWGF